MYLDQELRLEPSRGLVFVGRPLAEEGVHLVCVDLSGYVDGWLSAAHIDAICTHLVDENDGRLVVRGDLEEGADHLCRVCS